MDYVNACFAAGSAGAQYGKPLGGSSLVDGLHDTATVTKVTSSVAGITSESTFDFVGVCTARIHFSLVEYELCLPRVCLTLSFVLFQNQAMCT